MPKESVQAGGAKKIAKQLMRLILHLEQYPVSLACAADNLVRISLMI
ncbi:MAG: hypothetical protein ACFFEL_15100 [Candidatus Thorarchaeota archaeon]